jgi:Fis family transcriptional regulator, factor for inversion stimulation protein
MQSRHKVKKLQERFGDTADTIGGAITNQDEAADMSKESIQEVVQKSLEDYFNDLGEQKPTNIYDMMVMTVEKPILEVVMTRADGNQSHAAQMLGINRNTLRKKLQEHGLL